MVVLAAWLALVLFLGKNGAFLGSPGSPPLQLLLSVAIPLITFLAAYGFSAAFRSFVLAFDPQLGAGIQAWRFAGLGFLALYAYNILPGQFALPAGIGDMLIGITAPLVLLKLIRQPSFASTRLFAVWNLLGILDLVVAVSSGGLNAFLAQGTLNEVTTRPMAQLPLVLIPAYFVPIFMMVHFSALFQLRKAHCPVGEENPDMAPATLVEAH